MKNYVSPQMNYKTLTLFEKIANRCWAGGNVGFNDPLSKDDAFEAVIKVTKIKNCGDDELFQFLNGVKNYYKDASKYAKWCESNDIPTDISIPPSKIYQETKGNWNYVCS